MSQGEESDVLSSAGRDHGALSLTSSASLCQAWTMSAMKTSSPTPPQIRFPSNMSSSKDFFSMTRQKVISQEGRQEGEGPFLKLSIRHTWQLDLVPYPFSLSLCPVWSVVSVSLHQQKQAGVMRSNSQLLDSNNQRFQRMPGLLTPGPFPRCHAPQDLISVAALHLLPACFCYVLVSSPWA